jgi:hypothetical protein
VMVPGRRRPRLRTIRSRGCRHHRADSQGLEAAPHQRPAQSPAIATAPGPGRAIVALEAVAWPVVPLHAVDQRRADAVADVKRPKRHPFAAIQKHAALAPAAGRCRQRVPKLSRRRQLERAGAPRRRPRRHGRDLLQGSARAVAAAAGDQGVRRCAGGRAAPFTKEGPTPRRPPSPAQT